MVCGVWPRRPDSDLDHHVRAHLPVALLQSSIMSVKLCLLMSVGTAGYTLQHERAKKESLFCSFANNMPPRPKSYRTFRRVIVRILLAAAVCCWSVGLLLLQLLPLLPESTSLVVDTCGTGANVGRDYYCGSAHYYYYRECYIHATSLNAHHITHTRNTSTDTDRIRRSSKRAIDRGIQYFYTFLGNSS